MIIDLFVKAGPVIVPILLGSVIGFAIVVEKFLSLRVVARFDSSGFAQKIYRLLKNGDTSGALELCDTNRSYPIAVIFKVGIERRSLPAERLEKILEQIGNDQVNGLERHLGILASIVSVEPLMGFLGTITGLIHAFMSWEKAGADVTVSLLASGIYEAMITTATALTIAIPLYLFYNYFVGVIRAESNGLTNYTIQLVELLSEKR